MTATICLFYHLFIIYIYNIINVIETIYIRDDVGIPYAITISEQTECE